MACAPGSSDDVQVICRAEELLDGGRGVRFAVGREGQVQPAFVVRYRGVAHAYLNRCAHRQVELDWVSGEFFDREQRYLICATHGARYEPDSGRCVAGPCVGAGLVTLPVAEHDGRIFLTAADGLHLHELD